MKNDLKAALDERLAGMDWHGEARVWRRVKRRPVIRLRTALVACALMALLTATALAARTLLTGARVDAGVRAREALKQTYGLTDDTLALFGAELTEEEGGWQARYAMPLYAERTGEYAVSCEGGRVTASWSRDGASFPADGGLSSPVWGQPQLERLLEILHEHDQAAAAAGGLYDATLEQRAAVDAPLLEIPCYHDYINILPGEDDLAPEEAEALARTLLAGEYGLDADALAACAVRIAFRRAPENGCRQYEFDFTGGDGVWYRVWLSSPEGGLLRVETNAALAEQPAAPLYDPEDIMPEGYESWTIEQRYACAEAKRQAGRDPKIWRDARPEEGELTEEAARQIAEEAICAQYGVAGEALSEMELQTFCEINYWLYEDAPFKEWFFWFQDGLNNYQVRLRASDGTVEKLDSFDDALGFG